MPSTVRLICPNLKCRAILSVPTSARGKVVRCRQCGMRVTVPGAGRGGASGGEHQTSEPVVESGTGAEKTTS